MPNVKKYIERGACREDLVLLGAQPTITPPMWTTLATGTYPCTHGITCISRQSPTNLAAYRYVLDSRLCKAEQLWNVTAEAGKKTLVFHWPGSSWPPTSDSPNLYVVDGSAPGSVNMGVAQREDEFILAANEIFENLIFQPKVATNANEPCVITDLDIHANGSDADNNTDGMTTPGDVSDHVIMIMNETEGQAGLVFEMPKDIVQSPITAAKGWTQAPADGTKEFILLLSGGLIRRYCQILANADGVYDQIAIYRSKKDMEPMLTLKNGEMKTDIVDECIKGDNKYNVIRYMKVLELRPDGGQLKMWISAAMDIDYDETFHPKSLYKTIIDNIGYVPPTALFGNHDPQLVACTRECWDKIADWQAGAINYLIDHEQMEVVFSHYHAVDLEEHRWIRFMTDKAIMF